MVNTLTFDFECNTFAKGNPYSKQGKAVCVGYKYNDNYSDCTFSKIYGGEWGDRLTLGVDLAIAFNAKFDLAWARRLGWNMPKDVWCCQLAEFILERQENPYPSLEDTAKKYGLGGKIDLIKEEYWERKCSCYVSIVQRLMETMPEDYVLSVIAGNMKPEIAAKEIFKKLSGEKTTQKNIKQTTFDLWKTLSLILIDRLEKLEPGQNDSIKLQIKSTIYSCSKLLVEFVDQWNLWLLTTTILPSKLEKDFVVVVTLLLDMWKKNNGYLQHYSTCENTKVDTEHIPHDVLSEYCKQDVDLTYAIFRRQQEAFVSRSGLYRLFKLACKDLLILQEMEWNGLLYNEELCNTRVEECKKELAVHSAILRGVYPNVPINFGSNDQLSAFLYGGTVTEVVKELAGAFKSGKQKGLPKYVNKEIVHTLPRLVQPLPKSEMAKPNIFSTSADTLKKLKGPAAKKYVGPLLEMARLEKLISTYYEGIPKLNKEKDWEDGMIHGQFNQCVAATGRLSSSAP